MFILIAPLYLYFFIVVPYTLYIILAFVFCQ
ncbi:hypothetical protein EF53_117 [Enterococcus phage 53]|nr:hypothetical protein EF53_117 [Enterococcus phage 53]